jgi:hypothetical protein
MLTPSTRSTTWRPNHRTASVEELVTTTEEPMPLRKVLVSLIVLSTVAFAVGAIVEHSSAEPAAEGSGTEAPAHGESGGALEGSGEADEGPAR